MEKIVERAVPAAGAAESIVNLVLTAWQVQIRRADTAFGRLSEQEFFEPVASGKNRIVYLYGHLIAVDDALLPLFGIGERLFPELTETFLKQPDGADASLPPLEELKRAWNEVHTALDRGFKDLSIDEWLGRHTAVTLEDFSKDPSRNKLSVLLSRTSHVAYHLGQLALKKK